MAVSEKCRIPYVYPRLSVPVSVLFRSVVAVHLCIRYGQPKQDDNTMLVKTSTEINYYKWGITPSLLTLCCDPHPKKNSTSPLFCETRTLLFLAIWSND